MLLARDQEISYPLLVRIRNFCQKVPMTHKIRVRVARQEGMTLRDHEHAPALLTGTSLALIALRSFASLRMTTSWQVVRLENFAVSGGADDSDFCFHIPAAGFVGLRAARILLSGIGD
jgi:hypothetical protein